MFDLGQAAFYLLISYSSKIEVKMLIPFVLCFKNC